MVKLGALYQSKVLSDGQLYVALNPYADLTGDCTTESTANLSRFQHRTLITDQACCSDT